MLNALDVITSSNFIDYAFMYFHCGTGDLPMPLKFQVVVVDDHHVLEGEDTFMSIVEANQILEGG